MTEQPALFDGYEPLPGPTPPSESAGRRMTRRQRERVAAGVHPLTLTAIRPDLGTCGSCLYRTPVGKARAYPKCLWTPRGLADRLSDAPRLSYGPATDVRAWWPACPDYMPKDQPDAYRPA